MCQHHTRTSVTTITAAAAALATRLGASSAFGAEYEMVIAHLLPEDLKGNEIAPGMAHFESLVQARTNGDIDVKVFAAGAGDHPRRHTVRRHG